MHNIHSMIPYVMYSHLVHLVCGAVLADSNRNGGLVWQGYPQFYISHSIVVLRSEATHDENSYRAALTVINKGAYQLV